MENRQLRNYYRQALYGNRSPVARCLDFLALRFALFAGLYVFLLVQTAHFLLSAILAAVGMLMISCAIGLWKSIRLDRFIEEKRLALARDYLFERSYCCRARYLHLVSLVRQMGYQVVCEHPLGLLCRTKDSAAFILALKPSGKQRNPAAAAGQLSRNLPAWGNGMFDFIHRAFDGPGTCVFA
ncbi:MAG: hypothetical protein ACLUO4_05310 [Christensenellales bacterium]